MKNDNGIIHFSSFKELDDYLANKNPVADKAEDFGIICSKLGEIRKTKHLFKWEVEQCFSESPNLFYELANNNEILILENSKMVKFTLKVKKIPLRDYHNCLMYLQKEGEKPHYIEVDDGVNNKYPINGIGIINKIYLSTPDKDYFAGEEDDELCL